MKKNIYILISITLLVLSSCDDSELDISNDNTISTGNFWQKESDIEAAVVSIYNMFYRQGTWTRNMYTQIQGMADDGVSYSGWTELSEYSKFIFTNYDFSEVNTKIWEEHYIAIFRANQVLDNVENVDFASQDHKDDLVGQAKFLRSFYYFYLATLYENVPLVLSVSSPTDQPEQKSAEEIFVQLEEDLLDAISKLPVTRSDEDLGRITKGAAYALLAKVYMQNHKYQDAIKCFEWLVDGEGSSHYDLVEDYGDNFRDTTENNKESIMEIQFSLSQKGIFDGSNNAFNPNAQLGTQIEMNQAPPGIGWNNIEARRWLVDYYKREKTIDGENDIRLYYSLWYNDAAIDFPDRTNLIYGNSWDSGWGDRVFIKKYSTDTTPPYFWNDNNFRLLRYADVLLLYAEALNQLQGPNQKAIDLINRVRERVRLPKLENSTFYDFDDITSNKESFHDHIKIERALELSMECVRWIDLKRWGLDDTSIIDELIARDTDFENFLVGKSSRMPIPQSEVDNNENLEQNPGY